MTLCCYETWQVTLAVVWLSVTVVWLELPVKYALVRHCLQIPSFTALTIGDTLKQRQCRYVYTPIYMHDIVWCIIIYCLLMSNFCQHEMHSYPLYMYKSWSYGTWVVFSPSKILGITGGCGLGGACGNIRASWFSIFLNLFCTEGLFGWYASYILLYWEEHWWD